jgi:hypothetical protein
MTPLQKRIYSQIDSILWNEWDPIGINDFDSARDEYYDYIPIFFKMIYDRASLIEIADRLTYISTKTIGLMGNRDQDMAIAKKIFELEVQID